MLAIGRNAPLEYGIPLLMSERRSLFSCKDGRISSHNEDNCLRRALMEYYGKSAKYSYNHRYKPIQMMKKCVFGDKLCSENDTVLFQNFRYGNCITFNKRRKDIHPLTTATTGPGTGLVLEPFLNYEAYWEYTEAMGMRVVIHDPEATPSPEDEGFNVSPGFEKLVSLKKTVSHRLPAPFKDKCVNYQTNEASSASNKNECIRVCIQTENYAKYGCTDQTSLE
ncbi:hypothetical protein AVEN_182299-1 [Araneus ventricosus]|nr:hypothetical protein AVEN_62942-1 [Araneus ventricosus]GBM12315.1 hypothetical protein AVEN_182299-1 [Araneus ventricosus]